MSQSDLLQFCILFNRWRKRCSLHSKGMPLAEEWKTWPAGFISFAIWSLENGFSQDLVIDRIDGNKGYSPENCRWVTWQENTWNSSSSKKVVFCGKKYPSIKQLWKEHAKHGISYETFKARLLAGWAIKKALTTKPSHGNGWKNGRKK